jgi:hypothetical protein
MKTARHLSFLFFALAAFAAEPIRYVPGLNIPRVSKAPTLQQFIDDTPREAETKVDAFIQREPHDGDPVSQPTAAYLSYDDKNLYVAFVCKDDPKLIRARMAKREDIISDDWVVILLDTFHDHRRALEFFVNPYGVQLDGIAAEGQDDDFSWDAVWQSDARLTPDGWVSLVTIPFRSIRFSQTPIQQWGIFLARNVSRNDEVSFWPRMTRKIAGFGTQMGHLDGLENISPGRNMQFVPYFSMSASRSLDKTQPIANYRNDYEPRGGFDSKIILKDALTLDLTVNPDFSQVESDEPQVTMNQRFEVYFPEKRPFFLENSDFFLTPETLFFSRRVIDPEFGARLTGKVGKWSIAGLGMDDRAAGMFLPDSDPAHDARAKISIGRMQREFANASSLGVMYTDREFADSFNRVLSIDGTWRLDKHWTLTGQTMRSFDRDLAGIRLDGMASRIVLERSGRDLKWRTTFTDRTPNFRTQLGFINRVDMRQWEHRMGYLWHPKEGKVLEFGPIIYGKMNWDREGRLQDWMGNAYGYINLPRGTEFGVENTQLYELVQGLGFRQHRTNIEAATKWTKWLGFNANWIFGRSVNYFPKSGLPYYADWRVGMATIDLRMSRRTQLSNSYIFDALRTLDGKAIYDSHVLRTKLNYQFTPRLSVRTIMDYHAVLPNSNLVTDDHVKRVSGDVLMTYMIHPGTALYVGYTDVYENALLDRSAPQGWRRAGAPTNSVGRQVFIKLSYLFHF